MVRLGNHDSHVRALGPDPDPPRKKFFFYNSSKNIQLVCGLEIGFFVGGKYAAGFFLSAVAFFLSAVAFFLPRWPFFLPRWRF